ncbi:hypothetical protein C6P40_004173 [Pichia californica]|uniref:CN hydrolase domain-containing protein n=1 Tax=Pichia californica TaxID=460514 RepID=A0A9P6WQG7_9ASCO|nr:hypothetical protein C6P42_004772 [[Candida] californica]KAG0689933.1 hypothetical protein C6P40_004173 [[Candida] californica]
MSLPITKVAACHIAPVWLDTKATIQKAIEWIREAHSNGAQLVCFPETFVPCYPSWTALKAPVDNHDLFHKLCDESIYVDGPEIMAIQQVCLELNIIVCLGFNEKSRFSVGCLWNSYVLIGDDGSIMAHHRKIMPTYLEKLIWAPGDGAGLTVCDTKIGKIGALICGENTNPLAKYTLIGQGEQIHLSLWPAYSITRRPGDGVNYDLDHATKIRSACQAFEAKTFTVVCSNFFDESAREFFKKDDPANADCYDNISQCSTLFMDPSGTQIGESLKDKEGIAYCTFDLNKIVELKQIQDLAGYYQRYDVFKLSVDRTPAVPVRFLEDPATALTYPKPVKKETI